ncbi:acyl carrier protein [Streptomyces sp. NPDC050560]|uniref:acyl carrier protein n=1 Tax=Streptomyces sp. NPDC050560 TaxID=3365630 RepID=UPI0037A0530C
MERSAPSLPEEFVSLLTDHFPLDRARLVPDATFESLEMDSLALMEMVTIAEEDLGFELPDEAMDLTPATTLGEAVRALNLAPARHAARAS